jgi:hypothetical protein
MAAPPGKDAEKYSWRGTVLQAFEQAEQIPRLDIYVSPRAK